MSLPGWVYTATLVPLGVPTRIPLTNGTAERATVTFDETTFEAERKNPGRIKVWVDHARTIQVGTLARLYPQDNWWRASFVLDDDIDAELQIGQPMSVGISEWKWGSISLDEVSIVRHGAVRGAEVVERLALRAAPKPSPPAAAAPRTPPAARAPAGEVIYGNGTIVRRNIGQVLAVGGMPLRTNQGEPIHYERDNIIVHRNDGTQIIYSGREGHADFAHQHRRT